MRKNLSKFRFALLGIIMCLISVCAIGQTSRTYSYAFTSKVWSSLGTQSIGGWDWTASGTSTSPYFGYSADNGQQFGSKSNPFTALTLTTNSVRGTISSVKVKTSGASNYVGTLEVKIGGTNLMLNDTETVANITTTSTEYEFTGSLEAGAIELIWNASVAKALYLKSIEVTYIPDPRFVDAPTFTPAAGNYYEPASVTLATLAEGATIYYTIDGTEPSTSSLLYQEPIAVEQTTTIKAIAVRDTNSSEISAAVYSFPINVNTIADFKSQGINNSIYKLTTTAKVIYNNPIKKYLFIQDETGALVMYNYTGATYNAGDEFTGSIYGTYSLYNGMNEMVFKAGAPALPEATAGTPVDAIVATIQQLKNNYAYYEGRLVTVKNVTFIGNKRFVQGEDTMAFYTQLADLPEFEVGIPGNITGLVVYNSTKEYPYQLFPRSVNDIELPATLPYFVDFDQFVDSHLAINNGENTNKWYIGQAQDFDNNKLYISSTNGLTNKYDNRSASDVTVTRDIIIPAVGAVVSFDYHVNGESGWDYMQVAIGDLQVRLPQTDGWEDYTMEIPASLAGVQTLTLTWHNDASSGEQFPAAIDNISIHTPACVNPSGLQANVDSSSVTITWTPGEAAQNTFVAEYKLADRDMWNSHNVEGNTVTFANLQGNSEYQVRVKAVCGEVSSNWIETTFETPCQNVAFLDTLVQQGSGASKNAIIPVAANYYNSYSQILFKESELATLGIVRGSVITALDFNYSMATTTVRPVNLYLGTTDVTSLSSAFVPMTSLTQVFSNDCYSFSSENNNWSNITFNQPFTYNGGSLIVATLSDTTGATVVNECFTGKSSTTRFNHTSALGCARYCQNARPITFNENGLPVANGSALPGSASANRVNVRFGATVPVCQDTELCADMVSLAVLDETSTTATLKWVGAQGQNNFKLELIAAGAENQIFTVSTDTNVVEYELTGLNPLTSYTVNVWANCGVDQNSNKKTASFTTGATCPSVTNIVTSNMSNTTTVIWQAGSNETEWNVQFKKTSEGDNAWISLPLVQVLPTTTFGGLVGNTDYIIRIQPVCEGAAAWEYQYFTSGCASATIPYNITFGSSAVTEANVDCWLNNGFTEYASYYSTTQAGAEMISQALVIPTTGDFYVVFNVNGNYEISASSMGTRADRFSTLERGNMNGRVVILIPDIYKGKTVYFKLTNDANATLQLRKMEVTTCPYMPTSLTYSNITYNSIDLAWTAEAEATNFQVQYGEHGFTFGEGTIVDVQGNTTTINGLQGSTVYDFYVSTVCGSAKTDAIALTNVKTPCPPLSIPYFEGFEEGYTDQVAVAGCISQEGVSGSNEWIANSSQTTYNRTPRTGSWNANLKYGNSRWMFIPVQLEAGKLYLFEMYARQDVASGCTMKVSCGTQALASSMSTSIVNETTIGSSFVNLNGSIAPSETGAYYIGIYAELTSSPWYVSIDDISITEAPTCGTPSIAVSGMNATITLGVGSSTPFAYDLQIGNEIQRVYTTSVDLSTVFALTPNTDYEISVRAICSETDNSEWSEPVSFRTPCMALDLPYTENFDGVTSTTSIATTVMPDCWNKHFTGTSTSYGVCNYASSTYAHSGTNSLRMNTYYYYTGDAYAVLPALNAQIANTMVSFYARQLGSSSYTTYTANIEVGVVTDMNNIPGSFTPVVVVEPATTGYELLTVALSNYTGQGGRIAFRMACPTEGYNAAYIDDIAVELLPTCGTPSISVSGTTATITPSTLVGTPESYVLNIGNEQQTVPATTPTTVVDLSTIFTLELNTTYEISVKSNCGETDGYSEWSNPVSFTTPSCFGAVSFDISTGTSYGFLPFYGLYGYTYSQQIYDAAEINAPAGGQISEISFYCTTAPASSKTGNIRIWMANTTKSTFSSTTDYLDPSQLTQVAYLAGSYSYSTGWHTITLDEPFEYDGTSNLMIAYYEGMAGYQTSGFKAHSTTDNKSLMVYNDTQSKVSYTNPASSTGTHKLEAKRSDIKFTVCPIPVVSCGKPRVTVDENAVATIVAHETGGATTFALQIEGISGQQIVDTNIVNLVSLFGLESNTSYSVSAKAICGVGDESEWTAFVPFTTPCTMFEVPYFEDFETATVNSMPDCWNVISASSLPYVYSSSYYSSFTTKFLGMNYAAIVATPKLNIPANHISLEFDYTQESITSTNCGPIMVGFTTNLNATAEDINWVDTINNSSNKAVEHHVLSFAQLASTENGYVVFRSQSSNYLNAIDNISITEIPTCGTPSIAVAGTTATITPSTLAGTPEAYVLNIGNEQRTVPATTPTTIVGLDTVFALTPSTDYEISVRANCGGTDNSEWTEPVQFTTPCLPFTIPYFEGFESGYTDQAAVAGCITQETVSGSNSWIANSSLTDYNRTPRSGSWNAYLQWSNSRWMFIPVQLEAGKTYIFEMYARQDASSGCSMNVSYGNAPTAIAMTNTIVGVTNIGTSFVQLTGSLTPAATGMYYVGIHGNLDYSPYYVSVDDISITEAPTCGKPSIAVQGGVATITPSEIGGAHTFAVQIDGINGQQIVDTNIVDLVSLFSLDYNTAYSVSVKAICGVEDESEWCDFVSFTTPCMIAEVPYFEDFEAATEDLMPDCWTIISATTNPYVYSYSSYSYFLTQFLGMNYASIVATPKLNVPANRIKLEFDYTQESITSTSCGPIMVGFTTNLNATAEEINWVATINNQANYEVEHHVLNFTQLESTENGYVVFRSQSSNYMNAIDNVSVTELPARDLAVISVSQPKDACEITEPLKVTVKNTGVTDAISSFTLTYQVNTTTPVSEIVNMTTALQPGEEYVHTFNNVVYMTGNIMVAVELENDGDASNNTMVTENIEVLDPIAVPYVEDFAGVVEGHGWNVTDLNQDGVTFTVNNKISYAYNDAMNANDVIYSPCVDLAAGKYNVYFDYNAVSNMTEGFNFFVKNNATGADTTLAEYKFSGTQVQNANVVFEVTEAGTYEFGFLATSLAGNMGFEIDNFSVYPIVEVQVAANENGVVNPAGTVEVNYGDDLVLSIMPNTMYHVGGITVDGELVQGEDANNANFMLFTLNNVTEPHNVYVDFKLEFHIIKSVANFKAEYTDVPGWFVPAATDTTNDVNPRTLSFFAAPHYHLYSLEEGLMSTENMTDVTARVEDLGMVGETHEYSFTTDTLRIANYYYKATFRRDTLNIQYNVLTGKGYADDSQLLEVGQSHLTWVDYSVAQDVNHTSTFVPYTTGDAHSDYHIVDVTVDGQSQGVINNYTFTDITANHNVDIKYGYQVNATVRNYAAYNLGSTEIRGTIAPAQQLVAEGDATTVTGTIQENFHLYNLFVDGVDKINDVVIVENPEGGYNYTYTIESTQANYNIEAVVKLDTVGIHYHVIGGQGYADFSGMLNEGDRYITYINFGDSIMSAVMSAPGYTIANYILEGFDMGAINFYQFNNVRRDRYVRLNFVADDIAIVTNAYGHGTVTEGMNFTYNPETPVNYNFVATPEVGYHITSVMINGESQVVPVSGSFQYSIENVTENYTFDVIFEANTYTMNAVATGTGMIDPVGVQTVAYGSNMNYVATAFVGSYISSVVVDGEETTYTQADNVVTLNIPFSNIQANHNVAVSFAVKSFGITADVDANGHGSIDLSQHVVAVVNYGMGHVFNFIPEEGYHVSQVLVDGEAVEVADSYQFVNVQANHTLVVSFAINEYTLTATSNVEACTITPAQTTANYGTTVNYTINVATGYHLVNVMDNGTEVTVSNNAFAIENINDNHIINANFEANTFVVTVNQPAHAVITPGTQTVAYGATPEYVIVPQAGYEVVSVTAGNALVPVTTVNGVGHFTLSPVHANLEINAVVAQATYTITVLPSQGQGTVSPATNQTVVYGGNKVFTFTPAANYVIGDIIVDGVSKGALTSYTFVNVVANHTIQAVFEGNCMVPTNLSVNNVTSTSAQLSWSNTGAASYTVRYQAVGETTYHETTANTNNCTINGLTQDAIYYWSVKSNCGAGNESEYSYEMQFITEPASECDAPTNLTVDEVYNEYVKVSWTSNAASFNVRCKREADDPSTYVYTYGVNGTEYIFNNLFQATTYNWGVQTICNYATGNLSAWAESTFTTGSTGIASDELSSIKVYSHLNNVYVVNDNGIVIKDVKIYDIYGKLVYTGNATSNPEVIALNVANGNYVVKLDTENGVAVYKLAIIR